MDGSRPRRKEVNTTSFWKILLPIIALVVLFAMLIVVYTMPEWALDDMCSANLLSVRKLANSATQ
jgi:hypothetical protein